MVAPTGHEQQYYDQLFAAVNKDNTGVLPGSEALPLLTASGLPQQTLGEVWAIADPDNNGFITKDGWYRAARVIGWLQKGNQTQVDASLVNKAGPYPTFSGYPAPPQQPPLAQTPLSANTTGTGALPPLTAADRTKFTRIFVGCGPSNGLVSGDKARDVFLKSKLNYDKLGLIWNLADTQQRGALDLPDFIIGMYLIQSSMANPSLALPMTLPPGTYEAASGGRPPPVTTGVQATHTGPTSPIQRQLTGTLQPQITGQSYTPPIATPPRSSTITPSRQSTSAMAFALPTQNTGGVPWDVTPEAKATSDRFFAQLDTQNKGVIEGDVAVPFMLQSQLDEGSLASIWDLADIRQEGKLDRSEFAVAMHLINSKLSGKELPTTVPHSLIPPHLRSQAVGAPSAPPTASKDLFDLFDDAPEQASAPQPFLPQPPSRRTTVQESAPVFQRQQSVFATTPQPAADLLGDETSAAPTSVLDRSAEIGNKKNQLENTTRSVHELETSRAELEQNAAASASQLAALEAELATARSRHEAESKTVSDLRVRVGEQAVSLKQLQADVISAESDLTAMRLEKDELEQALLSDKEEVRGLQRRMKELEDEKTGLKLLLEKFKKDARQQKGMVTIAKKQLSTAEGSRDAVQQEVRDTEKAIEGDDAFGVTQTSAIDSASFPAPAGVPLPRTPQTLSPEATGASQRSNNPFDRFNKSPIQRQVSSTPDHSHSAAAVALGGAGVAAGVAAGVFALGSEDHESATSEMQPTAAVSAGNDLAHDSGAAIAGDGNAAIDVDPFGIPVTDSSNNVPSTMQEDDPFGQATPEVAQRSVGGSGFDDSGFGDSFHTAVEQPSAGEATDFDTAFADFDDNSEGPTTQNNDIHATSVVSSLQDMPELPIPSGISPALVTDLRPDTERTASTQDIAPSSSPATPSVEPTGEAVAVAPASKVDEDDNESSDEDEGPEDVDGPRPDYGSRQVTPPEQGLPSAIAPVVTSTSPEVTTLPTDDHKVRRSAPPPPVARGSAGSGLASPTKIPTPASPGLSVPSTTSPALDPFGASGPLSTDPFGAPAPTPPLPAPVSSTDDHNAPVVPVLPSTDPFGATATSAPSSTTDPFGAPAPSAPLASIDPFGAPAPSAVPTIDAFGVSIAPTQPSTGAAFDPFGAAVGGTSPPSQPPSAPSASEAHDPFGVPFTAAVPTVHALPKMSQFDDEDEFDFSDLPPTKTTAAPKAANPNSAFDDEFASFDDEFENPTHSSSDNSNSLIQTYEVVSPKVGKESVQEQGRGADEWGVGSTTAPAAGQSNTLSFDDAFGGDFEPTSNAVANAPPLPERPDLPQADDLEDVKKLCSMGFSRGLVVDALDANGYDFQKALNVLLDK